VAGSRGHVTNLRAAIKGMEFFGCAACSQLPEQLLVAYIMADISGKPQR
jgi:hypothetical protein